MEILDEDLNDTMSDEDLLEIIHSVNENNDDQIVENDIDFVARESLDDIQNHDTGQQVVP